MDVLVVDDDGATRNMLAKMLERAGYVVTSVDNGLAAFAELQQRSFRAIVCDIQMPFLEGKGLFAEIQEIFPAMAKRVVFVSGFADEPETKRFLQDTGQPYLSKPVRASDLVEAVARMAEEPG